jgi:hypothetical protein
MDGRSHYFGRRSIHDCIAALKPKIFVICRKTTDEELSERGERRKKQQEEDAT